MGNMAITASMKCKNYVHVVFNNGAHDSVGGQPTVGLKIDLCAVAKAVGYVATYSVETMEALEETLANIKSVEGPILLQVWPSYYNSDSEQGSANGIPFKVNHYAAEYYSRNRQAA